MAQSFSDEAQRGYEHRIVSKSIACPLDMSHWTAYLTIDIMAGMIFGAQYNLLEKEEFRYVVESIEESNKRMGVLFQSTLVVSLSESYNVLLKRGLERSKHNTSRGSTDFKTRDAFASLEVSRDTITRLALTHDALIAECVTLIVAGSDSSSTSLSTIHFYLAHNPEVYAKAVADV
ncbi:cytochrome P450 [Xylariales sp. PMI_506]|nr:cytochrome P450 [Xylariales sp. PMI_506]